MSEKLKQLNGLAEADVKVLQMGDLKVIALFKRLKPNIRVLNIKLMTNMSNKKKLFCFEN